jgi:hypothetical protein
MTASRRAGKFESEWRLWELPELLRQMALTLRPDDPTGLSMRAFDAGRIRAEWPDAPTAAALRRRLGGPEWANLISLCVAPSQTGERFRLLSRWLELAQRDFSDREVGEALRLVARLRGRETLREGEYAEARLHLIQRTRRTRAQGKLVLPTLGQVRRDKTWTAALSVAGLPHPEVRGWADYDRETGLSTADLMEACLEVHGAFASRADLELFARANRLAMAYERPVQKQAEARAEVVARRAEQGLAAPVGLPAAKDRPDYGRRVDPVRIPERFRIAAREPHSQERCVDALRAFLKQLPSGLIPNVQLYAEHARRTPRAPVNDVFRKFGGFHALRDLALERHVMSRRVI